eukprot:m.93976 g.93976  ORF g.93976 m.93976 type:complete len:51 (+) comp26665_c0_seq2:760-912(+)
MSRSLSQQRLPAMGKQPKRYQLDQRTRQTVGKRYIFINVQQHHQQRPTTP